MVASLVIGEGGGIPGAVICGDAAAQKKRRTYIHKFMVSIHSVFSFNGY